MAKPTAEDIRRYREENECGMQEAKTALTNEHVREELGRLRSRAGELYTVEACSSVLADLLDLMLDATSCS